MFGYVCDETCRVWLGGVYKSSCLESSPQTHSDKTGLFPDNGSCASDPLWKGSILCGKGSILPDGRAGMAPVLPLPCFEAKLSCKYYSNLTFPSNDSFKEFWTYEMPSAQRRTAILLAKIAKIQWPAGYSPGSANQDGKGATLKAAYKASTRVRN